jgi:hypothetical protein
MKEVVADKNMIAFCGLYCGACGSYLKGKCLGCQKNAKATWCAVRKCNLEHKYASCADCTIVASPADCKMLNNMVAKMFALFLGSNRNGAIEMIKRAGYEGFAKEMTGQKRMTPKKTA